VETSYYLDTSHFSCKVLLQSVGTVLCLSVLKKQASCMWPPLLHPSCIGTSIYWYYSCWPSWDWSLVPLGICYVPVHIYADVAAIGTRRIGDWASCRTSLDAVAERETSAHTRDWTQATSLKLWWCRSCSHFYNGRNVLFLGNLSLFFFYYEHKFCRDFLCSS
jgi:hypothetical protein